MTKDETNRKANTQHTEKGEKETKVKQDIKPERDE